jgi:hypothetical protein
MKVSRASLCHYAECLMRRGVYCYAECHYAECRYAECYYAECLYAECRSAELKAVSKHYSFKAFFIVKCSNLVVIYGNMRQR